MSSHYGKPDINQSEIVDGLRAAGFSVAITTKVGFGFPDLVVGKYNQNWLLEVKSEGGKLNDREAFFHIHWRGQAQVVYSLEEALEVCGG